MTLVAAIPAAIPIRRVLCIPPGARIVAGPSRCAVDFHPDVATAFVPAQRFPAPVPQPLPPHGKPGHGQKHRSPDQDNQPTVRTHRTILLSGACHV